MYYTHMLLCITHIHTLRTYQVYYAGKHTVHIHKHIYIHANCTHIFTCVLYLCKYGKYQISVGLCVCCKDTRRQLKCGGLTYLSLWFVVSVAGD